MTSEEPAVESTGTKSSPPAAETASLAPPAARESTQSPTPLEAKGGPRRGHALFGFLEWFWRSRSLTEARAGIQRAPARVRECHRTARLYAELGELALDTARPLRSGSAREVATDLWRKSCYWSLRALHAGEEEREHAELWHASDPGLLLEAAAQDPDQLERVQALLTRRSYVTDHGLPLEEQLRSAAELRTFANALLQKIEEPQRRIDRLSRQRIRRVGGLLLLAITVIVGLDLWAERRRNAQDLAVGKPWRASSEQMKCFPQENRCDGAKGMKILFHTADEESPWFEIDLGARRRFSGVWVANRRDCCTDRAIPLIVEVSNDQKRWKEVARRDTSFRQWTASFEPQDARWVRLRVPRRSTLHLESVKVLP